jgi:hypothetical protein
MPGDDARRGVKPGNTIIRRQENLALLKIYDANRILRLSLIGALNVVP